MRVSSRILKHRLKINTTLITFITILIILIVFSSQIIGSTNPSNSPTTHKLRVGVLNTPPFSYFINGKPLGLAYEIWEIVARENNLQCEYLDIGTDIDVSTSKIQSGEIDVALGQVVLLASRQMAGLFSLPFYNGNFVILAKKTPVNLMQRFIDTLHVIPIYIFLMIFILYMSYMVLFYFVEHDKQEQLIALSGYRAFELILWRSLVYGLRSPPFFPASRVVRTISVLWTLFFTGLLFSMIAGMTSIVVAGWLDAGENVLHLSDLDNKFVDVQGGNLALDLAQRVGLNIGQLDFTIDDAIKRLNNHDVDAIFMSKAVAVNYMRTHKALDLYLAKIDLPSFNIGYLFNLRSEHLLSKINYSILKTTESGEKMMICRKYLGTELAEHLCL